MKIPADAKPLPWYITLAVDTVWDWMGHDIWSWSVHERTQVFIAALDAEQRSWSDVECAVFDMAKKVLRDRERRKKTRR